MPLYIVQAVNRQADEQFGFVCDAESPAEAKIKSRAHGLDPIDVIRLTDPPSRRERSLLWATNALWIIAVLVIIASLVG